MLSSLWCEAFRRSTLGDVPKCRLNALLNAASDSEPTRSAIALTVNCSFRKSMVARCMRSGSGTRVAARRRAS
jgi:hypothetical protein